MTKSQINKTIKEWSVLFVDDDLLVLDAVKELFPFIFDKVYFASNGLEGIQIAQENDIDLVITDFSMPQMNGLDMIKQIKQLTPNIKVICISGHNEKSFIEQLDIFKNNIIIKPINSTKLYTTLEKIISQE